MLCSLFIPGLAAVLITPIATNSPAAARSITGTGVTANPIFSGDGNWLFFASSTPDLLDTRPLFTGLSAYRKSLKTGLVQLLLPQADNVNLPISTSRDGNRVLIRTDASNLTTNSPISPSQLVLLSVDTGTITPISFDVSPIVGARGGADGIAGHGIISQDGRWIVFESTAGNLVQENPVSLFKLVLLDTLQGTRQLLYPYWGQTNDSLPELLALSDDARSILVKTVLPTPTAYTTNQTQESSLDVYHTAEGSAQRLTIPSAMEAFRGTAPISFATMSPDGLSVLARIGQLNQTGTNRIGGAGSGAVVHWNLVTGKSTVIDEGWISVPSTVPEFGLRTDPSLDPALSVDGHAVLFHYPNRDNPKASTELRFWSEQTGNLELSEIVKPNNKTATNSIDWPKDAAFGDDADSIFYTASLTDNPAAPRCLFRRQLQSGLTSALVHNLTGEPKPLDTISYLVSPQSGLVALTSPSDIIVEPDLNRTTDLFLINLTTLSISAVNSRSDGPERSRPFSATHFDRGGLSANGRWITFTSYNDGLVTNDNNHVRDIFIHDAESGSITLVSVGTNGVAANRGSINPIISGNGTSVVFSSVASDLVPGTNNQTSQLYFRDRTRQITRRITRQFNSTSPAAQGGILPSVSSDGKHVAFLSRSIDLVNKFVPPGGYSLYIYDSESDRNENLQIQVGFLSEEAPPSISDNGSTVALAVGAPRRLGDLLIFANNSVEPIRLLRSAAIVTAVSGDGRMVAYANRNDVFAIESTGSNPPVLLYHRKEDAYISELQFAASSQELLLVDSYSPYALTERRLPLMFVIPLFSGLAEELTYPIIHDPNWTRPLGSTALSSQTSADGRWIAIRTQPVDFSPRGLWETYLEIQDRDTGTRQSISTNFSQRKSSFGLSQDGGVLVFSSSSNTDSSVLHRATITPVTVPVDSDADGLPDAWERRHFHSLQFDSNGDEDRDGVSNLAEYLAGTSPSTAPHEVKFSHQIGETNSWIQLDIKTSANAELRVFSRPDLSTPWSTLRSQLIGSGVSLRIVEPILPDLESKFLASSAESVGTWRLG